MMIAGDFTSVNGNAHTSIARLNSDGSVDTSFNAAINGQVYNSILLDPGSRRLVRSSSAATSPSPLPAGHITVSPG